jgi:hypothetical protein
MHLESGAPQPIGDQGRRPPLLMRQLRVLMQVPVQILLPRSSGLLTAEN